MKVFFLSYMFRVFGIVLFLFGISFANSNDRADEKDFVHRRNLNTAPAIIKNEPMVIIVDPNASEGTQIEGIIEVTDADVNDEITCTVEGDASDYLECNSSTMLHKEETIETEYLCGVLDDKAEYSSQAIMWLTLSDSSILKYDIETHTIMATFNPSIIGATPEGITTDSIGNAYVVLGNGVMKIGLVERNQCIDKDGLGSISTSVNDTPIANDECILDTFTFTGVDNLLSIVLLDDSLAIVSGDEQHYFLNLKSGELDEFDFVEEIVCGGIQSIVSNGVYWSVGSKGVLRYDLNDGIENAKCINMVEGFSIAANRSGDEIFSGHDTVLKKYSADGTEVFSKNYASSDFFKSLSSDIISISISEVDESVFLVANGGCPIHQGIPNNRFGFY
eukprot:TRINITY_DN2114_c0_g1_i3.p1 TRINITY_DN2114_c0_g1~~TRINITY_DN2114_c0_g1_i3.p1  ORF type:complete len:391 (+),score=104.12 TRINITY_DN2114_c0_g1_i3:140-1312(+)